MMRRWRGLLAAPIVVGAIWAGPAQDATAQAAPGDNPWTVTQGPVETLCEGEKETVRIPLFVQLAARDIPRTGGTLSQIVVHFGLEGAPVFTTSNGERYPLIGDYFSAGTQAPDANEWEIVLTPHPWAGTPPSGYYDFSDNYDLGPGPHRFNVEVLYWWADDGVGADDPPTEVSNLTIDVVSPNCSTTPPPAPTAAERAAAAARARTGPNTAQATYEDLETLRKAEVDDIEWTVSTNKRLGPAPVGEWSGDCVKLPFLAWYLATGIQLQHGHAKDNATYYMKQPGWHPAERPNPSPPPVGAVVFYGKNGDNEYGHEAISLGNGQVATTIGMDHDHKDNAVVAFQDASRGRYLGYYLPPG
jgi:cell wall-associated NlpC family hydrolase